jgi:hypothetical protein
VLFSLTEHHAKKSYWGSGGTNPRIFQLGTRWRWVVSFTPRPLHRQGKSPWCLLDRRLGGSQSRSGLGGEEKNSQLLPGLEPPIIRPVTHSYTTELSQLIDERISDANYEYFWNNFPGFNLSTTINLRPFFVLCNTFSIHSPTNTRSPPPPPVSHCYSLD